jgi:D-psicose/D-tagatose/L-ribulose 3-epimerase
VEDRPAIGVHAYVFGAPESPGDWERVAASARTAGYDLLEVPLLDARNVPVAAIRGAADRHGLTLTCSAGLTRQDSLSDMDPVVSARGEESLVRAVEAAAELRAPFLTGVLYGALDKFTTTSTFVGRQNCVDALERVAERARAAGVTLGIEAVNRYETNLVNTAEQAMALVRDVGAPNVVVHLDAFHMNIEETDFSTPVALVGPLLGYVHVAESHRGALGTGTVDLDGLLRALVSHGFAGPIVFEAFSASVLRGALAGPLAVWRDLWQDPLALARAAFVLIEERLAAMYAE